MPQTLEDSDDLVYVPGKNKDLKEVYLKGTTISGKEVTLLTFAQAYGFRNIQNVMRKIKQGKSPYDYVELMACPSGCVNGGGQVKLSQYQAPPADNAELASQVSSVLSKLPAVSLS